MPGESQLSRVLRAVDGCAHYSDLYAMDRQFNTVGLTIQHTAGGKVILCRLIDGQAVAESVCDDYIFLGTLGSQGACLSDRTARKISDFIIRAHGQASTPRQASRSWQRNLGMREPGVLIQNEDVNVLAELVDQDLLLEG